jgi:hypothetical protein
MCLSSLLEEMGATFKEILWTADVFCHAPGLGVAGDDAGTALFV